MLILLQKNKYDANNALIGQIIKEEDVVKKATLIHIF